MREVPVTDTMTQTPLLPQTPMTRLRTQVALSELPETLVGPEPSKQLLHSLQTLGQLEPILIRRNPAPATIAGQAEFVVLSGRRRVKAARILGWSYIEANLLTMPESDYSDQISITVHATRQENPVAEALAIRDLLEQGFNEKQIAASLGLSPATIKARLRLFNLSGSFWMAFEEARISPHIAEAIAKLSQPRQEALWGVFQAQGKVGHQDIRQVRQVDAQEAMEQLPADLFRVEMPPAPKGVSYQPTPEDLEALALVALGQDDQQGEIWARAREAADRILGRE